MIVFATTNFRTPRLDLDNVYGLGPDGSPQLYARDPANITQPGPKLLIGKTGTTSQVAGVFPNDLPRSPEGRALIGDHRNDENLPVAQTQLAFLKFHNKVVDRLASGPNPPAPGQLFAEARIVAEVFVGLVAGDVTSYLGADPKWTPTLPANTPGTFLMSDLLRFVGEISPIDQITTG
jgi:Animal haem peroxidase